MTEFKSNVLELAKKGNPQAIALVINHYLKPRGINAKVRFRESNLQILLEYQSEEVDRQESSTYVRNIIEKLSLGNIEKVSIFYKKNGQNLATEKGEPLQALDQSSEQLRQDYSQEKLSYITTETDRKIFEKLKKKNISDEKIEEYFNLKKPYFGCLFYWLWVFFGFCAFIAFVCFLKGEFNTALRVSFLAVITFPPFFSFLGGFLSNKLPDKRICKKGIRDLAYLISFILFCSFAGSFIADNRSKNKTRPQQTIEPQSEDYPGQASSRYGYWLI